MLDIKFIRENKEKVKQAVTGKRVDVDIDNLLELDVHRRGLMSQIEEFRRQRNIASQNKDIEGGREIKQKLEGLGSELSNVERQFTDLMILVPNVPLEDVPAGKDEMENKVLRKWGEIRKLDFQPKDHLALGETLGIIDVESAGKVTGSRFAYLKGALVNLEFAIISYTFRILQDGKILEDIAKEIGFDFSNKLFIPVLPPVMIRPEVYVRMGRLDSTNEVEKYYIKSDDLYLIGSAEHTLGPLHMDQVIDEDNLPIRYVGFSTSFRREAGSYGKDVKGILRMHQFDKIEMESFSLPENGVKEQGFIVAVQEYLMHSLNLPYRVVLLCTGEMGGPNARQIDIETWMPGQNKYRETHSSDYMSDYQARRLGSRVRRKNGKIEFVHMNDATVFAIGRILIAILENYQQKDGSVRIPEILVPYAGFSEIKLKG